MAAALAQTPMGRLKVRGLSPFPDFLRVEAALAQTAEALLFHERSGRLPFAGVEDPGPALGSLSAAGGLVSGEELRVLLPLARACEETRKLPAPLEDFPQLSPLVSALPDFTGILRAASRTFDEDFSLADKASPRLGELRTRLRRQRQSVYERARAWLLHHSAQAAGDTVVVRDDRYCVPLSSSAGAHAPGVVHGRSGSGQTVFVEPFEIADLNNELSLLASDARAEEDRIRREFGAQLLSRGEDFLRAAGLVAELDGAAARAELARRSEAVRPELSRDGRWSLSGARHPLLDARLRVLRETLFGLERSDRDAVPLDFQLTPEKRWLLVSGPNAGGKTVALKTIGLLSMLAQSGFYLPAKLATVPVFERILTSVGDEQAILSDLSTFSSAMKRLAEILRRATETTLALLDELGAGTDPEEGGAIAASALEAYLKRGGRAVVTTHLTRLKQFVASREDGQAAAMEFDEQTGRPTYRLHAGLHGSSRALSTAREQGLPEETLARAEEILGEGWVRRQELEAEAAAALSRLRERERELEESLRRAREEGAKFAAEADDLRREKERLLREGRTSYERARREFRLAAAEAIEEIRRDKLDRADAMRRVEGVESSAADAARLTETEELDAAAAGQLRPGMAVALRGSSLAGRILEIEGGDAWIEAAGKRLRVSRSRLREVSPPAKGRRARVSAPEIVRVAEVNVLGKTVEEAFEEVDRAIERALASGGESLRVVHGHGTGRLRTGLRDRFRRHPSIESFRPGEPREGGNGATVIQLK
jgi:DNA mismatch repair protein MutS2